jgi:hypothetical protein
MTRPYKQAAFDQVVANKKYETAMIEKRARNLIDLAN